LLVVAPHPDDEPRLRRHDRAVTALGCSLRHERVGGRESPARPGSRCRGAVSCPANSGRPNSNDLCATLKVDGQRYCSTRLSTNARHGAAAATLIERSRTRPSCRWRTCARHSASPARSFTRPPATFRACWPRPGPRRRRPGICARRAGLRHTTASGPGRTSVSLPTVYVDLSDYLDINSRPWCGILPAASPALSAARR